jgi:2-methylcitrate dehydratase PrpD
MNGMSAAATSAANLAQKLGDYFAEARFKDLPQAVVDKACEHIWYLIIRAVQGHRHELSAQARRLALRLSEGGGSNTIIGTSEMATPIDAAFANSTQMRALEVGDNLWPVGVHAGIIVVPAALALAERRHRSGKDLITAVVSGYEVIGKLSKHGRRPYTAAAPHRETSVYGAFGSAIASAHLLSLDADKTAEAIRYAAEHAMGLAEGLRWDHFYALVTRNGVMSAMLAEVGGRVSPTAMEGRFGLFETFLGALPSTLKDPDLATPRGEEILGARTKRLPGTAWNVVTIELARELVRAERLTAENVARIDIRLSDARRNFPIGHHLGPYERWRASSSAPFQIAMLILDGGESRFERYWQNDNPDLLELVRRMTVTLVPHEDDNFARIDVTTTDGRRLSREGVAFSYPRWDDRAELLAAGKSVLPEDQLRRAANLLDDLPNVADVAELMSCFRAPVGHRHQA